MSEPAPRWSAAAGSYPPAVPARSADGPRRVYLYPGRLLTAAEETVVTTILGSCVAVGLWDSGTRIGGINHFMLPHGDAANPKYANCALPLLLSNVIDLGAKQHRLVAAIFGGATLAARDHFQLGPRNVEVAVDFLADEGIPVVRRDAGGDHGRKVVFRTSDGDTTIRRL